MSCIVKKIFRNNSLQQIKIDRYDLLTKKTPPYS